MDCRSDRGAAVVTRLSATGANSTADIKQGDVLIGVHGALVATTGQALEALRKVLEIHPAYPDAAELRDLWERDVPAPRSLQ